MQMKKFLALSSLASLALLLSVVPAHAQSAPPNGVEATSTPLIRPHGLAYDASGNYYIADTDQNVIRKVSPAGIITTVAGTGEQGYAGDGGLATAAVVDSPAGVAVDSSGNIYIADTHNNVIREVLATTGIISTIAGTGVAGYSGDSSTATAAMLNHPTAVAVDSNGNLYIADTNNHVIREVTVLSGNIATVAGDGEQVYLGDGVSATTTGLDSPSGVAVDSSLNIYIGDTHNQLVRMVTFTTGIITTLAGTGVMGFTADGPATSAALARPRGVTVDTSGNVYLADSDNNRIREITGTTINTIAGSGLEGYSGDTGLATSASLDTPDAVALSGGSLLFSDTENNLVRALNGGAIDSIAGSSSGQTESLVITGATPQVCPSGTLIATFSNGGNIATGLVTFLDGEGASPAVVGSQSLSGNIASLGTTLLSAGTHFIVASYAGDANNAPIVSGVFVLTVTPGPFTGFTFISPPQAFTGWPIYVTVTAVDQCNNTVTTFPDTVHVTSSDPAAVLPPDSTLFLGSGTFEATLNTVGTGSQTFTVTDTANSIASTTSPILVLATPNLVVTTAADDAAPGDETKCTPQATPGTGTDAACSLRDALNYSSSFGGANITFDSTKVPTGTTITLISGSLDIPNDTSITSTGTRTVSGGNISGVFTMQDQNAQGIINGLSITGGNLSDSTPGAQVQGAGIDNDGTLTVENSTISGNSASASDPTGVAYGGAIYTDNDLEISNSTVSGNSATAGGFAVGGGIFNSSYMNATNVTVSGNTVSVPTSNGITGGGGIFTGDMDMLDSTVSGNTAQGPADGTGAAYGGGIFAIGNASIEYSTISGNTATALGGGVGGGIYALNNQHEKNTTISNNSADGDAGGYYLAATARLANTILSGNHAPTNADFDNQGTLTDRGGNLVSITGINLAALANNGGPTQTMVPQPGSPAICGGLLANIPPSEATDQRGPGHLNTNTTYIPGSTCVDVGAIQTNYSLSFGVQPPTSVTVGAAITPAPKVVLNGGGYGATTVVMMTDTDSVLTGTTSVNLASGTAAFSNLIIGSGESSDSLTATMALTSSINLTTASSTFSVNPAVPAALTSPTPGSTLTSSSATFTWSAGAGVSVYEFRLGTTGPGSKDVYNSAEATTTALTSGLVSNIPTNGATLYARIYSWINGAWQYHDYTYTESATP